MKGAVEVWRGSVDAWECDEMGHLNIRFYLARAWEGLTELFARLGMTDVARPAAAATFQVREHHVRFLREARAGAALHMVAGISALHETEAEVAALLLHSGSGAVCAAVTSRVAHVTARAGKPFPWSSQTRAAAGAVAVEAPEAARPRGLGPAAPALSGSLERADALGLKVTASGVIGPGDCDAFGRARPEAAMRLVSSGYPHLFGDFEGEDGRPLGGAMLECRLVMAAPGAELGDRMVVRSALAEVGEKVERRIDWLLDPESGRPSAALEAVVASFDLEARKLAPRPPEVRARLLERVVPGLTL